MWKRGEPIGDGCARIRSGSVRSSDVVAPPAPADARIALIFVLVACTQAVLDGSDDPARAAVPDQIRIDGHGWGHGRGMGQFGAYGYAVDHGWSGTMIATSTAGP